MGRGRKRKVAVTIDEEKENESESGTTVTSVPAFNNGPMYKIMSHVQTSEALHKKYIKEMQQLYTKMDHDAFLFTFIRMIKSAMECDETNEYASTSLRFCAKYIASYEDEDTHPVIIGIFNWISQTISHNPHIRFRLCQFVNLILSALGTEAALDDGICDKILEYMIDRLRDMSPSVRVQAIIAMQRLQAPDNPNDQVLRAYQFHLCSDPSPRVRQAVITSMGRNYITIPYILDRLWDIDEKVRRHTYLHMSSYPVRSYKVSQRLMLLEQGLNDRAESVRKVVTKVMLRQWLESYQKDIIALVSALKLDANEGEIERFRKVTKQTLQEIFKSEDLQSVIALLPIDYEGESPRCIPYENLTVENALYWQCLSEFLQVQGADEFDLILPELSVFCEYVESFCKQQNPDEDKFQRLEFQYKLLALLEILYKYDLGDEIGRGNFQNLVGHLLRNISLDDKNIAILIRCAENLMSDQDKRMQFLTEIVQELCQLKNEQNNLWNDRTLINEALANCADPTLNLKLSGLKVKILDLEEQEMVFLQKKNFVKAQEVTDEKNVAIEEFTNLLKPLLSQPLGIKKVKNENILTSLQIIFHMVVSEKVRSLSPQVCKLYNDFICRHIASVQIPIRDWALKCGTAYSMHYEPIAKELFNELYYQFFKHHNARIWETSVKCVFEIMDMYGVDSFSPQDQAGSSKRSGRTLYNTLGSLDADEETQVSVEGQSVSVMYLMSHFLDTCDNVAIVSEIILGFIKLILHGFVESGDIIEKLLIRYFNPSTDTKINQYLSIFLEEMIRTHKQKLLISSLLPTITAVLTAPYDSPLLEIRPETITRFFIDITRQDACPGLKYNLHNKIARSFLTEMLSNTNNKELCKLLAKEILKLELDIRNDAKLKEEMQEMSNKLLLCEFDVNTMKNVTNFKGMLEGTFNPPARSANDTDDDDDDTLTNENQRNTVSVATTTASIPPVNSVNNFATDVLQEESESTPTTSQVPSSTQESCNSGTVETDKTLSESNKTNTDEGSTVTAVASADSMESSQNSLTSAQTTPIAAIPVQSQSQSMPTPAPVPITTYGRQNRIGQHYLRKSLNLSRTQSESELSDQVSVPKIRIEVRIDSEKKMKTNNNEQNNSKDTESDNKTPKMVVSACRRSLRQLRRRRKSVSPKPVLVTDDQTSDEESSSEETNSSDFVPESPQPRKDASTRLNLTLARLSRSDPTQNSTTELRSTPAIKPAKNQASTSDVVPESPQPASTTRFNTSSSRLRRAAQAQSSAAQSRTTPVVRASQNQTSASDVVPESPQPSNTTRLNFTSTRLRRTAQVRNVSSESHTTTAIRTSQRQTSPKPTPINKKHRVRSPRKVLYTNLSPQLGSNLKRSCPKTSLLKKKTAHTENSNDSTSSSTKSPQPKQARRSNENQPKPYTPQPRNSAESSNDSTSSSTKSPQPKQARRSNENQPKQHTPKSRKSANNTVHHRNEDLNSGVSTRSASKMANYLKTIVTRNKKCLLPSRIPIKSSNTVVGHSRSSSTSPLRRNANIQDPKLAERSRSLHRSKIPRKLN